MGLFGKQRPNCAGQWQPWDFREPIFQDVIYQTNSQGLPNRSGVIALLSPFLVVIRDLADLARDSVEKGWRGKAHGTMVDFVEFVQRVKATCGVGVLRALCVGLAVVLSAGCSEQVLKHGQYFSQSDLQQIQPGMSKEQVRLTLGSPSTTATASSTGGDTYYYISSTATQAAFFKPTEKDRQVVAIYFNPLGSVDRVANYGLKDGKVFDFISRTTPAPGGKEDGILKSLFRNLGQKQIFGE